MRVVDSARPHSTRRSRRPQACGETPSARTGRPRGRPSGRCGGPEGERDERQVLHVRSRGVVPRCSTDEAAEPKRGAAGGGCGGKAVAQGEHDTAYPVPDTEPEIRVKWAGVCAPGCTEGWGNNPARACGS